MTNFSRSTRSLRSSGPRRCASLVIVGASARAAAQSAIRAGYEPWCVDLFADRDLQAIAPVRRCPSHAYPGALVELIADGPPGAPVLLTGALENYPQVLRSIEARRPLLGLKARQIERVRDPALWAARTVPHRGLVKQVRGSNGSGIRPWDPAEPLGPGEYVQAFAPGTSISAVFQGKARGVGVPGVGVPGVRMVGVTHQIVGDPALGARPFQYAGSIGPIRLNPTAHERLFRIGQEIAEPHGLRGLFGIDAILDGDTVTAVEINPRYTASMEVLERATNGSVLQGRCDPPDASDPRAPEPPCWAKAYVYAKEDAIVGDLYEHLGEQDVADVPHPGTCIRAGHPVCTVLARCCGPDCVGRLHALAHRVYTRGLHAIARNAVPLPGG